MNPNSHHSTHGLATDAGGGPSPLPASPNNNEGTDMKTVFADINRDTIRDEARAKSQAIERGLRFGFWFCIATVFAILFVGAVL